MTDKIEEMLRTPVKQDYRDAIRACFEDWNNRKRVSMAKDDDPLKLAFWMEIDLPAEAFKRVLHELLLEATIGAD